MKTFNWKSAALFTLSSMCTGLLVQACGTDNGAVAQSAPAVAAPDPIEGTFQSDVTIRDCTTGAKVTGFRGLTAFHAGGTATADNDMSPTTKSVAVGTWSKGATGTYAISLRFFRVLPNGAIGQQRLQRTITLAADGKTLTSTLTAQLLDPTDNVIQTICGVETGTRFP